MSSQPRVELKLKLKLKPSRPKKARAAKTLPRTSFEGAPGSTGSTGTTSKGETRETDWPPNMAPRRGQSIERTSEYDEFMKKLQNHHEKRGTHLDPEPKVGVRHLDLRQLYERVVGEGGYDAISDTKARPLMWRKLAEEFLGKNQYLAAQAFQVKNVYYKNLVAFEISDHWHKEPPPKEILEEVTAKGGNVMNRTLENFARPVSREAETLANGQGSSSPEAEKTPKEEKTEGEDPGSASGRTTRGLRHAPPQRVLFQPETTSGRQTRGQSAQQLEPTTPGSNGIMNASHLTNGTSHTLASYEPSQSYPLSLKPVTTPANNPEWYRQVKKRKLEAAAGPVAKKYKGMMLPGTGFIGPNIYVRAQLALQSGLPEEEQYALHHLVKISHERGDKYRFDQFPGLAEALVRKVLQISSLFYDITWDISYDEDVDGEESLNGLRGTPDLLTKLKSRIPLVTDDDVQTHEFISQLGRITEAGLVIRNMCMLEENAQYLSRQPLIRDYLAIVLNLPHHEALVELQHYALETAEQVLKYSYVDSQDAVYQTLLTQLDSTDRGAIAICLRAIARIGMMLEGNKRLEDVPEGVLVKVCGWVVVEDDELRMACLDFLFQFTSIADNVEQLIQAVDAEALVRLLTRLLLHGAREKRRTRSDTVHHEDNGMAAVPRLSRSLVEGLLKCDEPERSSEWLRMCFTPDALAEMTQISLWQAYQGTFAPYHATHPHMIAGDFIKNVSTTFAGATAQVAGANKYVIKGIKPRHTPVDTGMLTGDGRSKGRELHRCHWKSDIHVEASRDPITGTMNPPAMREIECGEWFRNSTDMLKHILGKHLSVPTKRPTSSDLADKMEVDSKPSRPSSAAANGHTNGEGEAKPDELFDFEEANKNTYTCRWGNCGRQSLSKTALFARHIQTHMPDGDAKRTKNNLTPKDTSAANKSEFTYLTTLTDDRNDAAGVPLGAALVLRNIARGLPKTAAGARTALNGAGTNVAAEEEGEGLMHVLFDENVKQSLFYTMAHNTVLKDYVATVLRAIRIGGG